MTLPHYNQKLYSLLISKISLIAGLYSRVAKCIGPTSVYTCECFKLKMFKFQSVLRGCAEMCFVFVCHALRLRGQIWLCMVC